MNNLKGKKAVVINGLDGQSVIRIYDDSVSEGFTDYELWHSDLSIIIDDEDTQVKKTKTGWAIDYSKETLGE